MPVVPRYDQAQVAISSQPGARVDAPQMPDVAGRQAQQMGQAMQNLGGEVGRVANDMAVQANQLRFDAAATQARELAARKRYGDGGYESLRGGDALFRPDNKYMPDEYGDTLKKDFDKIGESLGNDAQRQMFARYSGDLLTSFKTDAMSHVNREYQSFHLSQAKGSIAQRTDDIARSYGDIDAIEKAINGRTEMQDGQVLYVEKGLRQWAYDAAKLTGASEVEANNMAQKQISNGLKLAMLSALEKNDVTQADALLNRYAKKGLMDADDILAVRGHITKEMDARVGMGVAAEVMGTVEHKFNPSSWDNVVKITIGSESGGKRYGPDGTTLLTSAKGAKGEMQVLDGTKKNPGFGVKPAQDDSPDERARVGRDYLGAMAQRYSGDMAKMWAAYNAGPGAVDMAIAKSQPKAANDFAASNWLSHLPAETQAYVAKNLKAYDSGEGRASKPTFAEIDDQLRADPRLASNPARYRVAREEAARRFDEQNKAVKQREEESVSQAMRGVMQNGGRWSDLPASIRASVPPDEVTKVMTFAQRVSKGDDSTSPLLYQRLTGNPQALATMSEAGFFALRAELSEADFKHFANERAKLTGAALGSQGPGDLNTQAIKQTLDQRLRMLKVDPTPKDDGGDDAARVGALRQFVDTYMYAAQRESGKKFSDAEVTAHIDSLFAKNDTLHGFFSNKSAPMLSMKVGDISSEDSSRLKDAFKRRGVDNPTDAQILNSYWTLKVTRK